MVWTGEEDPYIVLASIENVGFPMVLQGYAPHPGDYYRFTTDSLRTLFQDYSKVELRTYGNSATASGSPQYLMSNHFSNSVLNYHDPVCPSIVAVAAWK